MIHYELMRNEGLLRLTPAAPLEACDFQNLSEELDPYIEVSGKLRGILIDAEVFPGWKDFAGLMAHLRFVERHHKHVEKVAVLSDDRFLSAAPTFVKSFVDAEIKHFPHSQRETALHWLMSEKRVQA